HRNVSFKDAKEASDLVYNFAHESGNFAIFGGSVEAISDWLSKKGVFRDTAEVTARVEVMRRDIRDVTNRVASARMMVQLPEGLGAWGAVTLSKRIAETNMNVPNMPESLVILAIPQGFNDYAFVVNELGNVDPNRIVIVEEQGGKNVFYDIHGEKIIDVKSVSERVNVVIGQAGTRIYRKNKDVDRIFTRAMSEENIAQRYSLGESRNIQSIGGRTFDVTRMGSKYNATRLAQKVGEAIEKGSKIDSVQVVSEADTEILSVVLPQGGKISDFVAIVQAENGERRLLVSPDVAYEIAEGYRTSLAAPDYFQDEIEQITGMSPKIITSEKKDLAGRVVEGLVGGIGKARNSRGIDEIKYSRDLPSLKVGESIDIVRNTQTLALGHLAAVVDGYDMRTSYAPIAQ
ncbi:MAG: hypothetical protein KAS92_01935, partial [Candidatus Omnitrophica bacterium]|nr:hypothetical protein [Candidatus Omnitrophota bacterium]